LREKFYDSFPVPLADAQTPPHLKQVSAIRIASLRTRADAARGIDTTTLSASFATNRNL